MKYVNKSTLAKLMGLSLVVGTMLFSCQKDESQGLGSLPKAVLTATVDADGHSVRLLNKSATPVIAYWAVPALNLGYADLKGDTVNLSFIFPGTYTVKLMVSGRGGIDTTSTQVTTTVADPTACDHSKALGFIASCTSRTWKLYQGAGAYKVGPGANDGSWWTNGVGDVASRSCEFDDEYTFSFDANGTFVYNSHGDFYADGYMGNNTNGCEPESNFTATQAPWGSGTHKYAVIAGAGLNQLGQLKVIGLGAHIGLQKVTTNAENTSGPVSSITYDVLSMSHDPGGFDVLVIGCNMGFGWWTFALQSN